MSRSSWGSVADVVEAVAVDPLADEHAPPREAGVHLGHVDEGVAVVGAGEGALVLGLELVVELLEDPLADLAGDRLRVQAGGERLGDPDEDAGVGQVGLERLGDAGVLDLHGDVAAVVQAGAVDLADRGGGGRLAVERREVALQRLPSYSASSTSTTRSQGIAGASARSLPSCSW